MCGNPSGLRRAKTAGGSTKYFVYNGMNIVYEYEDSIADGTVYYYGLNRTHNSNGEIYVYNARGDTVQLVKNNVVVVSYTYDAFGNLISQIGRSDNPFLYCGEYFDAETSTYYLRARYYDPANGRFIQQDAWGYMDASDPLSLNLYTYCCNNPVMFVDPSGHSANDIRVGLALSIDDHLMDGTTQFLVSLVKGDYTDYVRDSDEDYYLGRTIGAGISIAIGTATTLLGVLEIVGAVVGGGGATVSSGGLAAVAGVTICVEGAIAGAAEIGAGIATIHSASSGFENDLGKYVEASQYKKPASGKSGKEMANDVPSWAKGERPYKNEDGKSFAKRLLDKKYGAGNYNTGPASEFNKIKKWGDRGFE